MEQNLNSDKTPARASQHHAADTNKENDTKVDEVAMKAAKRAGNRLREDETTVPGSTDFTK